MNLLHCRMHAYQLDDLVNIVCRCFLVFFFFWILYADLMNAANGSHKIHAFTSAHGTDTACRSLLQILVSFDCLLQNGYNSRNYRAYIETFQTEPQCCG